MPTVRILTSELDLSDFGVIQPVANESWWDVIRVALSLVPYLWPWAHQGCRDQRLMGLQSGSR